MADILGHVEHDRSWSAACRHGECAPHKFGDTLCGFDADQFLDRWAQNFDLPCLLRHVLPGVVAIAVADENHQRNSSVEGFDKAGDEVGGTRTERAIAHTGTIGDAGIRVGCEGTAALIIDQTVLQPERSHRFVKRQ